MELRTALGIAIRQARLSKNRSQESFVPASSRTYMSVLELGGKPTKVEKVDAIAKSMEVHPLSIFAMMYCIADEVDIGALLKEVKDEVEEITKKSESNKAYGYTL